ncbi:MAG TPA: hypothetical protein DDY18_05085 [Flavobacterium sp.]|jgi:hypothetical protein|nr:hypothetical protein [Flavobacterium sp.]
MVFKDKLPVDAGATDAMDSARLAGLMATFDFPGFDKSLLLRYLVEKNGQLMAVRHPGEEPSNNPFNFTRDQLMCLAAGLHKAGYLNECKGLLEAAKTRGNRAQNTEYDMPGTKKDFPNGPDWLTPSHMNHLRLCAGEKPTLLGKIWLNVDILYSATIGSDKEPNQLMCMCEIAGKMEMLKRFHKKLEDAIVNYWDNWRLEGDLAAFLISKIYKK